MSEETKELKPLTKKHQKVQDEYLLCFNQWKAYKKAFPSVTDESARSLSSKLFADVNFASHLQARMSEVHMGADEALKLLADMARGDIGEFMDTTTMGFELNVDAAKKAGRTKLIKKIVQRTEIDGKTEKEVHTQSIELYSAKDAIDTLLKVGGKLGSDVSINVKLTDD